VKIAIVSQQYPPETGLGGIGTQAYLKAHGLAVRGHEVFVLSSSSEMGRQIHRDGSVTVIRLQGPTAWLTRQSEPVWWLGYSAAVAREIEQLHDEVGLDIVEFAEYGCEGFVHLLNRDRNEGIPSVVQLHGPLVMLANSIGWPELDSALYRGGVVLERACIQLADGVYSSSRLSAEWCAREYGIEIESIPIIHMGVDTDLFRPERCATAERPTVCFVGRLDESKGAGLLVDAAIDLSAVHRDLLLVLCGEGNDAFVAGLNARAESAGLPDLLRFTGFLPREELATELASAQVFAAPSLYEGGPGLVYLEAMACGLPVVAPSGSGVEETVEHGETGLLVAPEDAAALAEAIGRLLDDERLRNRLGTAARRFVVGEHDSTAAAERLERFFESMSATAR